MHSRHIALHFTNKQVMVRVCFVVTTTRRVNVSIFTTTNLNRQCIRICRLIVAVRNYSLPPKPESSIKNTPAGNPCPARCPLIMPRWTSPRYHPVLENQRRAEVSPGHRTQIQVYKKILINLYISNRYTRYLYCLYFLTSRQLMVLSRKKSLTRFTGRV